MKKIIGYLLLVCIFILIAIPVVIIEGIELTIMIIVGVVVMSSVVIIAINLICST